MEEFNSADILKNQNRKKRLAFLEVGMFEVSFVLIIIIVLFGILNYFNILSLSTLYPNQLGFLPHQKIVQSKISNASPAPSSSSPVNYVKLTNQASDSQIVSYKTFLNGGGKIQVSNPQENQFTGIFSGFDNEKFEVIDKEGYKYFYYTNDTVFGKFTPSVSSANTANTVGFPSIKKEELLLNSSFGTIIQVVYDSSQSARPTAKEIYVFSKI